MFIRSCIVSGALALAPALPASAAAPARAPIFEAIDKKDLVSVRRILEADPSQAATRDGRGVSPLTRALFSVSGDAFIPPNSNDMVRELLTRAPQLDFFETCAIGTAAQVESLLKANPKLENTWHAFGWTPLHFAAFGGNVPVAELLIQHGAKVNEKARSRFRNEPLAVALLTGQLEAARKLIEHGADVNARQAGGFAPIQEAALLGRRDLIDLLLENGAEINARANDGRNAVSEAERGKHAELAAYLRSRGGVDPRITADLGAEPKD